MSRLPSHARVVIVGAGIAGNALAYHLAGVGWRDIVLIDKGPLPNPGGSTGHASSFTFPVEYSRQFTTWCMASIRELTEMGVFTKSGGIEVARTEVRMHELRRRAAAAKAWGVQAELVSPAEIKRLFPHINETVLLGGFHTPDVGVCDPVRAGTLYREGAQAFGALTALGGVEVTGFDVREGRIRGVRTDQGDVAAETVVIAGGVWAGRLGHMAGVSIPLVPAVHQMISIGPVPAFMDLVGEIRYPVIRDMDSLMYERQSGGDLEIGSYAHRAILVDADGIPSNAEAALSPTELPFTSEDFDPHMEHALELFPEIVGDEGVGIRHAINGLISLTPDGYQLLGETEVKGLWSFAAMWIKEAPALARTMALWMTEGVPDIDPSPADVNRFHDHHRTARHVTARSAEWFPKFYGIVHPLEQWATNRDVRLGPADVRHRELGAVFFETAGWERPQWYAANEPLLERYGDRVMPRPHEWDARWWSPIINAEHLALRDGVGIVENAAFGIFEISGPGALAYLQRLAVAEMDGPIGRVAYTQLLNEAGGVRADVTISRLGRDRFRMVVAGATAMIDRRWLEDHLPDDGSVALHDATSAWTTVGLFGPKVREVLASLTRADVSNDAFPYATCQALELDTLRVLAVRLSYTGELGWELYAPMEQGRRLWDLLWEAGRPHDLIAIGFGAYGTTTRLEKAYRAMGPELQLDRNLVELGLARRRVKGADFIGKAALVAQLAAPPAALLCTLTVDDHATSGGVPRFMLGGEPVLAPDGRPLVDSRGRVSYVTSAGSGPSIGKHLLLAYLPMEAAVVGTKLAVEYVGERYPVTVAALGARPLFDPENARLKA